MQKKIVHKDMKSDELIFAIPKGRILKSALPILKEVGIVPEPAFHDGRDRRLKFRTNLPDMSVIRVRAFDVATFVAHGAAHMGIVGSDVIEEFEYSELYAPVDLKIGQCRLSLARLQSMGKGGHVESANGSDLYTIYDTQEANIGNEEREGYEGAGASPILGRSSHIRVATKYPALTRRYFARKGVQAECIKLNGAMELAPHTNLANHIVDLVESGNTLRENALEEVETILDISSHLVVNRTALKLYGGRLLPIIDAVRSQMDIKE